MGLLKKILNIKKEEEKMSTPESLTFASWCLRYSNNVLKESEVAMREYLDSAEWLKTSECLNLIVHMNNRDREAYAYIISEIQNKCSQFIKNKGYETITGAIKDMYPNYKHAYKDSFLVFYGHVKYLSDEAESVVHSRVRTSVDIDNSISRIMKTR